MILARALVLAFSALCSLSALVAAGQRLIFGLSDSISLTVAIASFAGMGASLFIGLRLYTSPAEPLPKRIGAMLDLEA
jgi:hypothetical protein